MEYEIPSKHVNPEDYDAIVSLGNKCPTAMILHELNIYKESFPFDYVPTTPNLILKYLKNNEDFFPQKNIVRTKDDVWFGHFNIDTEYDDTILKLKRRFDRLYTLLNEKKKILFCYTTEADLYNEMGNRYNNNMDELIKLKEYLIERYGYDTFTIVAIHVNKTFEDCKNIINYTIKVQDKHLSDAMETHTYETYGPYRNILKELMKQIFRV